MFMLSHAQIVNALGVAALAEATGNKPITVYRWKTRNSIPAEWWVRTVALARQAKVRGVTCEQLAILVAK